MGGMKTKKGTWVKPGNGGSYRGYEYRRAAPKSYQTTPQQHKIGAVGREIGVACKGKTGSAFKECKNAITQKARK